MRRLLLARLLSRFLIRGWCTFNGLHLHCIALSFFHFHFHLSSFVSIPHGNIRDG